jgi:hypothetical protein
MDIVRNVPLFRLPGIVRLEDARAPLDVVRRERRGAAQAAARPWKHRHTARRAQRQADEHQQGEPSSSFFMASEDSARSRDRPHRMSVCQ